MKASSESGLWAMLMVRGWPAGVDEFIEVFKGN
jgi:hypothetical protein